MFLKILDFIVRHLNTFALQKLLHQVCSLKMVLPCKQSVSVYDPVCGDLFVSAAVHCPAHHSCATGGAQILCDRPIRCNPSVWNLCCYLIYFFKKTYLGHGHISCMIFKNVNTEITAVTIPIT